MIALHTKNRANFDSTPDNSHEIAAYFSFNVIILAYDTLSPTSIVQIKYTLESWYRCSYGQCMGSKKLTIVSTFSFKNQNKIRIMNGKSNWKL